MPYIIDCCQRAGGWDGLDRTIIIITTGNKEPATANWQLATVAGTVTGNWQRAVGNCNWQHARLELKQIFVQSQRRQLKMAEMGDDNGQCIKTLHQTVGNLLAWVKTKGRITKEQREGGGGVVVWQMALAGSSRS